MNGVLAGVDGCKAGWVAAIERAGCEPVLAVFASFAGLMETLGPHAIVAVDMPIGLPERIGRGGRGPEQAIRPHLGARQSSVFSIPSRAAVYAEPLASKLVAMYAQTFAPGVQIGPKPDQNALLIYHTTTAALKSGDEMLSKFPGGYNDVLQYFIGNQPIVRFKFVTAGEELGLAFDGLVYVNGHWALMPKPWRALD